jgi:hypothetical protein
VRIGSSSQASSPLKATMAELEKGCRPPVNLDHPRSGPIAPAISASSVLFPAPLAPMIPIAPPFSDFEADVA